MNSFFLRIWKLIKNPFFSTAVVFVIWMLFFDSNSYLQRKKQNNRFEALEGRSQFYQDEILRLEDELRSIEEDPEELEKFAREKFFYKEKGEDIFILEN